MLRAHVGASAEVRAAYASVGHNVFAMTHELAERAEAARTAAERLANARLAMAEALEQRRLAFAQVGAWVAQIRALTAFPGMERLRHRIRDLRDPPNRLWDLSLLREIATEGQRDPAAGGLAPGVLDRGLALAGHAEEAWQASIAAESRVFWARDTARQRAEAIAEHLASWARARLEASAATGDDLP